MASRRIGKARLYPVVGQVVNLQRIDNPPVFMALKSAEGDENPKRIAKAGSPDVGQTGSRLAACGTQRAP